MKKDLPRKAFFVTISQQCFSSRFVFLKNMTNNKRWLLILDGGGKNRKPDDRLGLKWRKVAQAVIKIAEFDGKS